MAIVDFGAMRQQLDSWAASKQGRGAWTEDDAQSYTQIQAKIDELSKVPQGTWGAMRGAAAGRPSLRTPESDMDRVNDLAQYPFATGEGLKALAKAPARLVLDTLGGSLQATSLLAPGAAPESNPLYRAGTSLKESLADSVLAPKGYFQEVASGPADLTAQSLALLTGASAVGGGLKALGAAGRLAQGRAAAASFAPFVASVGGQEMQAATEAGASPMDAWKAGAGSAAAEAAFELPFIAGGFTRALSGGARTGIAAKAIERVSGFFAKTPGRKRVGKITAELGQSAFEEGVLGELPTQLAQNLTAKATYDPGRSVTEGAGAATLGGAFMGGTMGGGSAFLSTRKSDAALPAQNADRTSRAAAESRVRAVANATAQSEADRRTGALNGYLEEKYIAGGDEAIEAEIQRLTAITEDETANQAYRSTAANASQQASDWLQRRKAAADNAANMAGIVPVTTIEEAKQAYQDYVAARGVRVEAGEATPLTPADAEVPPDEVLAQRLGEVQQTLAQLAEGGMSDEKGDFKPAINAFLEAAKKVLGSPTASPMELLEARYAIGAFATLVLEQRQAAAASLAQQQQQQLQAGALVEDWQTKFESLDEKGQIAAVSELAAIVQNEASDPNERMTATLILQNAQVQGRPVLEWAAEVVPRVQAEDAKKAEADALKERKRVAGEERTRRKVEADEAALVAEDESKAATAAVEAEDAVPADAEVAEQERAAFNAANLQRGSLVQIDQSPVIDKNTRHVKPYAGMVGQVLKPGPLKKAAKIEFVMPDGTKRRETIPHTHFSIVTEEEVSTLAKTAEAAAEADAPAGPEPAAARPAARRGRRAPAAAVPAVAPDVAEADVPPADQKLSLAAELAKVRQELAAAQKLFDERLAQDEADAKKKADAKAAGTKAQEVAAALPAVAPAPAEAAPVGDQAKADMAEAQARLDELKAKLSKEGELTLDEAAEYDSVEYWSQELAYVETAETTEAPTEPSVAKPPPKPEVVTAAKQPKPETAREVVSAKANRKTRSAANASKSAVDRAVASVARVSDAVRIPDVDAQAVLTEDGSWSDRPTVLQKMAAVSKAKRRVAAKPLDGAARALRAEASVLLAAGETEKADEAGKRADKFANAASEMRQAKTLYSKLEKEEAKNAKKAAKKDAAADTPPPPVAEAAGATPQAPTTATPATTPPSTPTTPPTRTEAPVAPSGAETHTFTDADVPALKGKKVGDVVVMPWSNAVPQAEVKIVGYGKYATHKLVQFVKEVPENKAAPKPTQERKKSEQTKKAQAVAAALPVTAPPPALVTTPDPEARVIQEAIDREIENTITATLLPPPLPSPKRVPVAKTGLGFPAGAEPPVGAVTDTYLGDARRERTADAQTAVDIWLTLRGEASGISSMTDEERAQFAADMDDAAKMARVLGTGAKMQSATDWMGKRWDRLIERKTTKNKKQVLVPGELATATNEELQARLNVTRDRVLKELEAIPEDSPLYLAVKTFTKIINTRFKIRRSSPGATNLAKASRAKILWSTYALYKMGASLSRTAGLYASVELLNDVLVESGNKPMTDAEKKDAVARFRAVYSAAESRAKNELGIGRRTGPQAPTVGKADVAAIAADPRTDQGYVPKGEARGESVKGTVASNETDMADTLNAAMAQATDAVDMAVRRETMRMTLRPGDTIVVLDFAAPKRKARALKTVKESKDLLRTVTKNKQAEKELERLRAVRGASGKVLRVLPRRSGVEAEFEVDGKKVKHKLAWSQVTSLMERQDAMQALVTIAELTSGNENFVYSKDIEDQVYEIEKASDRGAQAEEMQARLDEGRFSSWEDTSGEERAERFRMQKVRLQARIDIVRGLADLQPPKRDTSELDKILGGRTTGGLRSGRASKYEASGLADVLARYTDDVSGGFDKVLQAAIERAKAAYNAAVARVEAEYLDPMLDTGNPVFQSLAEAAKMYPGTFRAFRNELHFRGIPGTLDEFLDQLGIESTYALSKAVTEMAMKAEADFGQELSEAPFPATNEAGSLVIIAGDVSNPPSPLTLRWVRQGGPQSLKATHDVGRVAKLAVDVIREAMSSWIEASGMEVPLPTSLIELRGITTSPQSVGLNANGMIYFNPFELVRLAVDVIPIAQPELANIPDDRRAAMVIVNTLIHEATHSIFPHLDTGGFVGQDGDVAFTTMLMGLTSHMKQSGMYEKLVGGVAASLRAPYTSAETLGEPRTALQELLKVGNRLFITDNADAIEMWRRRLTDPDFRDWRLHKDAEELKKDIEAEYGPPEPGVAISYRPMDMDVENMTDQEIWRAIDGLTPSVISDLERELRLMDQDAAYKDEWASRTTADEAMFPRDADWARPYLARKKDVGRELGRSALGGTERAPRTDGVTDTEAGGGDGAAAPGAGDGGGQGRGVPGDATDGAGVEQDQPAADVPGVRGEAPEGDGGAEGAAGAGRQAARRTGPRRNVGDRRGVGLPVYEGAAAPQSEFAAASKTLAAAFSEARGEAVEFELKPEHASMLDRALVGHPEMGAYGPGGAEALYQAAKLGLTDAQFTLLDQAGGGSWIAVSNLFNKVLDGETIGRDVDAALASLRGVFKSLRRAAVKASMPTSTYFFGNFSGREFDSTAKKTKKKKRSGPLPVNLKARRGKPIDDDMVYDQPFKVGEVVKVKFGREKAAEVTVVGFQWGTKDPEQVMVLLRRVKTDGTVEEKPRGVDALLRAERARRVADMKTNKRFTLSDVLPDDAVLQSIADGVGLPVDVIQEMVGLALAEDGDIPPGGSNAPPPDEGRYYISPMGDKTKPKWWWSLIPLGHAVSKLGPEGSNLYEWGVKIEKWREHMASKAVTAIQDAIQKAKSDGNTVTNKQLDIIGLVVEGYDIDGKIAEARERLSNSPNQEYSQHYRKLIQFLVKAKATLGFNPATDTPAHWEDISAAWRKWDDYLYTMFRWAAKDKSAGKVKRHFAHKLTDDARIEMGSSSGESYKGVVAVMIEKVRVDEGVSRSDLTAIGEIQRRVVDWLTQESATINPWDQAFNRNFGAFTKHRSDMFDVHLVDLGLGIATDYFEGAATHVAKYAYFADTQLTAEERQGMDPTKIKVTPPDAMKRLLNRISSSSGADGQTLAHKYLNAVLREGELQVSQRGFNKFFRALSQWNVTTKLTNPPTLLANLSQVLTFGMQIGPVNLGRSLWGLATSAAFRQHVKRGGAISGGKIAGIFTDVPAATTKAGQRFNKISTAMMRWSFSPTEIFNNLWAGGASEMYLRQLVDAAAGRGRWPQWVRTLLTLGEARPAAARSRLKTFFGFSESEIDRMIAGGVDTGNDSDPLGPTFAQRAIQSGAVRINFRNSPNLLPSILVGEGLPRFLQTFKGFAYSVTWSAGSTLIKPAYQDGNFKPLISYLIAMGAGGELLVMLLEMLSPSSRKSDLEMDPAARLGKRYMENAVAVGAMALIQRPGDLVKPGRLLGVNFQTVVTNPTKLVYAIGRSGLDGTEVVQALHEWATSEISVLKTSGRIWDNIRPTAAEYERTRKAGANYKSKELTTDTTLAQDLGLTKPELGVRSRYEGHRNRVISLLKSNKRGLAMDAVDDFVLAVLKGEKMLEDSEATFPEKDAAERVRRALLAKAPLGDVSSGSNPYDGTTKERLDAFHAYISERPKAGGKTAADRYLDVHEAYVSTVNGLLAVYLGPPPAARPKRSSSFKRKAVRDMQDRRARQELIGSGRLQAVE